MQLCALLGKLPDELLDGTSGGLGQERMELWMLINAKRLEWIGRNIVTAQNMIADAKDPSAFQFVVVQVLRQMALHGMR